MTQLPAFSAPGQVDYASNGAASATQRTHFTLQTLPNTGSRATFDLLYILNIPRLLRPVECSTLP